MVKPILCWPLQPLSYLLLSDRWAPTHLETLAPVPVLVIHGQQDNVVEPQFGEAIYEKLAEPKSIWRIPNGSHTDIFWQHEKNIAQRFSTSPLQDVRANSGS